MSVIINIVTTSIKLHCTQVQNTRVTSELFDWTKSNLLKRDLSTFARVFALRMHVLSVRIRVDWIIIEVASRAGQQALSQIQMRPKAFLDKGTSTWTHQCAGCPEFWHQLRQQGKQHWAGKNLPFNLSCTRADQQESGSEAGSLCWTRIWHCWLCRLRSVGSQS